MDTETIKTRARQFCIAHGLRYNCDNNTKFITIGQSGFQTGEIHTEEELDDVLSQCKHEHEQIESVKWESGLLYEALGCVGDDPIKSMIEEELARVLGPEALDKVARVFWKYTTHN